MSKNDRGAVFAVWTIKETSNLSRAFSKKAVEIFAETALSLRIRPAKHMEKYLCKVTYTPCGNIKAAKGNKRWQHSASRGKKKQARLRKRLRSHNCTLITSRYCSSTKHCTTDRTKQDFTGPLHCTMALIYTDKLPVITLNSPIKVPLTSPGNYQYFSILTGARVSFFSISS